MRVLFYGGPYDGTYLTVDELVKEVRLPPLHRFGTASIKQEAGALGDAFAATHYYRRHRHPMGVREGER